MLHPTNHPCGYKKMSANLNSEFDKDYFIYSCLNGAILGSFLLAIIMLGTLHIYLYGVFLLAPLSLFIVHRYIDKNKIEINLANFPASGWALFLFCISVSSMLTSSRFVSQVSGIPSALLTNTALVFSLVIPFTLACVCIAAVIGLSFFRVLYEHGVFFAIKGVFRSPSLAVVVFMNVAITYDVFTRVDYYAASTIYLLDATDRYGCEGRGRFINLVGDVFLRLEYIDDAVRISETVCERKISKGRAILEVGGIVFPPEVYDY